MKWLLFFLVSAAPIAAQCTYSVTPTSLLNVSASGASGGITVNTQPGCSWSYGTSSSWITLSDPNAVNSTVVGSDVLHYVIAPSTQPTTQTGNILIYNANVDIPVSQGATSCSMTLAPASSTISAAGGTSSFGVQTACTWTATSNTSWITVSSPATGTGATGTNPYETGTGYGTVTFTAAPNGCVSPLTGTISVTSQPAQTFTLTENGSPSNLTLSPATLSAPQAGVTGARFNVITGAGCNWTSYSDVGWLHITTNANGSGNGGLGYSIDANPGAARTGNIHVGAQLFAVMQAGVAVPSIQLTTMGSAASYATSSIAPGEIVSLFGANMGPTVGVGLPSATKNSIPTTLGGVQVFFDGNAAPMIYASATQINAIAPVGLAGKASTQVTVTYQSLTSNALAEPVQPTAPGLFAADGSGTGGGAILNQDYSLNARLNPAARGSVIAIYLTGAGVTNPGSVDGAITGVTPPFPAVAQPVSVSIGGTVVPAANILYSGAAPGSVEGLTQIDVLIPSTLTPGLTLPVVVTIGGVPSQTGITISVN